MPQITKFVLLYILGTCELLYTSREDGGVIDTIVCYILTSHPRRTYHAGNGPTGFPCVIIHRIELYIGASLNKDYPSKFWKEERFFVP